MIGRGLLSHFSYSRRSTFRLGGLSPEPSDVTGHRDVGRSTKNCMRTWPPSPKIETFTPWVQRFSVIRHAPGWNTDLSTFRTRGLRDLIEKYPCFGTCRSLGRESISKSVDDIENWRGRRGGNLARARQSVSRVLKISGVNARAQRVHSVTRFLGTAGRARRSR